MAAFSGQQPAPPQADIASTVPGGLKLRVLHIVESYPPDYGGGAAVTTRDICRRLSDRGHEVRVLTVEDAPRLDYTIRTEYDRAVRIDRVNLPYFRREDPDGWRMGLGDWKRHQRRIDSLISSLIDEWRPDLADYHTVRPFGEQCLETLADREVPVVATLHEAWLVCPRLMLLRSPNSEPCDGPAPAKCLWCMYSHYDSKPVKAVLKLPWRVAKLGAYPAYRLLRRRQACGKVEAAIARSSFMARVHRPHINGAVSHIPLGIEVDELDQNRHHAERPRTPLRFGFMAGFQPSKGILDVLGAASRLKGRGKSFELHIWGPGQKSGRRQILELGLEDRVFLRGMYAAEEYWAAYGEIDVALMATTVCEPMGRIPLEAAAAGVPTIAPAVGGIIENVRDGIGGLLYQFRDGQDLERQMLRILDEPDLIGRLIDNLPPVPDIRDGIADIEAFYLSVLAVGPELREGAALA